MRTNTFFATFLAVLAVMFFTTPAAAQSCGKLCAAGQIVGMGTGAINTVGGVIIAGRQENNRHGEATQREANRHAEATVYENNRHSEQNNAETDRHAENEGWIRNQREAVQLATAADMARTAAAHGGPVGGNTACSPSGCVVGGNAGPATRQDPTALAATRNWCQAGETAGKLPQWCAEHPLEWRQ